jgi:hypothetical protein
VKGLSYVFRAQATVVIAGGCLAGAAAPTSDIVIALAGFICLAGLVFFLIGYALDEWTFQAPVGAHGTDRAAVAPAPRVPAAYTPPPAVERADDGFIIGLA